MIPNHARFLEAIQEKHKVRVQFYSQPDSGVLDRVCAPMEYGPGPENKDGLNRYWLWDYASDSGSHTLGLVPQQIEDMQVLGEVFDPAQCTTAPAPAPATAHTGGGPRAPVTSPGGKTPPLP